MRVKLLGVEQIVGTENVSLIVTTVEGHVYEYMYPRRRESEQDRTAYTLLMDALAGQKEVELGVEGSYIRNVWPGPRSQQELWSD